MTVNMVLIEEAFAVLETGQMELDGQCVRGGGGRGLWEARFATNRLQFVALYNATKPVKALQKSYIT
jgi:hypothetical protein